jgi:hypothetical protein
VPLPDSNQKTNAKNHADAESVEKHLFSQLIDGNPKGFVDVLASARQWK